MWRTRRRGGSGHGARRLAVRIVLGFVALAVATRVVGALMGLRYPSSGDPESDEVALVVIVNGCELRSRATGFHGGSVLTVFGGTELDLGDATLTAEGATLETRTYLGGLDIRVPAGCRVEVDASSRMSTVDDRTADDVLSPDAPVLRVRAAALLSGVSIHR